MAYRSLPRSFRRREPAGGQAGGGAIQRASRGFDRAHCQRRRSPFLEAEFLFPAVRRQLAHTPSGDRIEEKQSTDFSRECRMKQCEESSTLSMKKDARSRFKSI